METMRIIQKSAFYKQEAALQAANEIAKECGGYVASRVVGVNTMCFDCPPEFESWSGEIAAYEVIDSNYRTVAYVGFWD